jgi:hypothetical protein
MRAGRNGRGLPAIDVRESHTSGGCTVEAPASSPDVMDPEEACQRAIEAGLVVHCAHPLNGETSTPALIGGVVMPSAQYGRLRARRAIVKRRSRTPDPLATPTRPRGPHSGSARESSLPAGPAPRLQNRNLCPNSATTPAN